MSPQLGSLFFFFFVLIMFSDRRSATAQRPSYAGSRPPSGLSQKHKYQAQYMSNNNSTNETNNNNNNSNSSILNLPTPDDGIVNRFGGAFDSRIDSNVTQRPPVGMPVVLPESVYVPLSTVAATATPAGAPQQQQPPRPQTLPIDAHGDADLVNRLSLLPEDQRPFWFLNYLAIEAQRNGTGANVASSSISQSSFLG